jgi:hypothetical protein
MPKFKGVEGGTPTGPPLCRTCAFAIYMRGASEGDVSLHCQIISRRLKTEKHECSSYMDKRQSSLENMYKTAWYLRTDEFHKSIGFVSPQVWRKKFRKDEDLE